MDHKLFLESGFTLSIVYNPAWAKTVATQMAVNEGRQGGERSQATMKTFLPEGFNVNLSGQVDQPVLDLLQKVSVAMKEYTEKVKSLGSPESAS